MTIVVLLFLAGIWATVLLPPALRARADGRPGDSIGSFRRQLHVLDRLGPNTVTPANRLFRHDPAAGPAAIGRALGDARRAASGAGAAHPGVVNGVYRRPSGAALARKRRRDVFQALLGAMVTSLVLGFVPALRPLWAVHLVLDVLFVAYVAMLLRMRNLAAERTFVSRSDRVGNIHYLPSPRPASPAARPALALGHPEPAYAMRRSAN